MSNIKILFIVLSIVFPLITYVACNNFIAPIIVLVLTALYLFLYAYPYIKKMINRNKRFHSCYSFINTFIISISTKGSLPAAFEASKLVMDKGYIDIIDGLTTHNEEEKLDYLKRHYDFDIYYLFLSVMKIYIEQGGDILNISYYLIEESRRNEDYLIKCEEISKRKIIEISMLWTFTLLIVLILRFSLNSFYYQITNLLLFQISIVALFLLLLASIHLIIMKVGKIEIKGYRNV